MILMAQSTPPFMWRMHLDILTTYTVADKGVAEHGKGTKPSFYLPDKVCFFHMYVFSDVFWSQNIVFNISNLHGAYYD
jgi:hypothetical protein